MKVAQHALRGQLLVLGLPDPILTVYQRHEVESGSRFYTAGSQGGIAVNVGSCMAKEKKPKAKQKKKRNGSGNLPAPEPIPGLPANESGKDKSNKDEKQRMPVPPGELPPLPIYAPPEPGQRVPVYF